jgi:AbrB family looped-hinge helix DNA binding protein
MRTTARVTAKWQVVIPLSVRDRLGIRRGDVLEFIETDEGFVIRRWTPEGGSFRRFIGRLRRSLRGLPRRTDAIIEALRGERP